jgi:hypothetical protein
MTFTPRRNDALAHEKLMKLHLVLLVILAFAAGVFAGEKKYYYRVDPVDSNTVNIACTEGRPWMTMRIDDVMEVHCAAPQPKKN